MYGLEIKKEGQIMKTISPDVQHGQSQYQAVLRKFVDIQYKYGIQKLGEEFRTYLYHILEKEGSIEEEIKKIIGIPPISITQKDVLRAKNEFLDSCIKLQQEGSVLFLEYLLEVFHVSEYEAHCIRLMYAFELDKAYGTLAAFIQDDWGKRYITPYLTQLVYEETIDSGKIYEAFRKGSILGTFFLKKNTDCGIVLLQELWLDRRILDFAMGEISITKDYYGVIKVRYPNENLEPWIGSQYDKVDFMEEQLKNGEEEQLFYLYGEEGSGKKFSVLWACKKSKRTSFFISLDKCYEKRQEDEKEFKEYFKGIIREVILYQAVPIFVLNTDDTEEITKIVKFMEEYVYELMEYCSVMFLCAKEKRKVETEYSVTYFQIEPLSLLEGKKYWESQGRLYPLENNTVIESMSNKFTLTRGNIKRILANAEKRRRIEKESKIKNEWITKECYEILKRNMGQKAQKVPAKYIMDDLILPMKQKKQLEDVCNQVKYKHLVYEEWGFGEKITYGRGISMAFIGSPGTGKTMAAQVIANELGMELYKVELSSVVSKYVGETEKNLNEIFEQARKSQVILFFDEADVLFSKRTEGKESTDKYSNMEAAFLLQKMEGHEGITILATNLFHHFDEAFKRRLKFVVEFPMPDEKDRKKLWKMMIPDKIQTGEIDFDYLARHFELTGSNIRNILLHSAFLAASKHKLPGMEEIIPAIKNEYAKNGKALLKEDVSEYYMYLD